MDFLRLIGAAVLVLTIVAVAVSLLAEVVPDDAPDGVHAAIGLALGALLVTLCYRITRFARRNVPIRIIRVEDDRD